MVRLVDHHPIAILLQQRLADPLHLQQLIHRSERAITFAVCHDRFRFSRADAKELTAQGFGVGGVEVDLGGLLRVCNLSGNRGWGFGFDGRGCGGSDGEGGEESEDQGGQVGVLHFDAP